MPNLAYKVTISVQEKQEIVGLETKIKYEKTVNKIIGDLYGNGI